MSWMTPKVAAGRGNISPQMNYQDGAFGLRVWRSKPQTPWGLEYHSKFTRQRECCGSGQASPLPDACDSPEERVSAAVKGRGTTPDSSIGGIAMLDEEILRSSSEARAEEVYYARSGADADLCDWVMSGCVGPNSRLERVLSRASSPVFEMSFSSVQTGSGFGG